MKHYRAILKYECYTITTRALPLKSLLELLIEIFETDMLFGELADIKVEEDF